MTEKTYNFYNRKTGFKYFNARLIEETDVHFKIFDSKDQKEFWLLKVETEVEEVKR